MNLKNLVEQYDKLQLLDDFIKFKYEPRYKKKLIREISKIIHNKEFNSPIKEINQKVDYDINDENEKKNEREKENENEINVEKENEENKDEILDLKQKIDKIKEKEINLNDEEIITTFEALNNPTLNKNVINNDLNNKMNLRSVKMLNNNVIQFEHPSNFTIFDRKRIINRTINQNFSEKKEQKKKLLHPCQENYLKEKKENEILQKQSIKTSIKKANKNLLYSVNNFPNIYLDKTQNKKIKIEFKDEHKFYDNNDKITAIKNFSKRNFINKKNFKPNKIISTPKKEEEIVKIKEIERDDFDTKGIYFVSKPFIPTLRGKIANIMKKRKKIPYRLIYSAVPKNSYEHYLEKYGNGYDNNANIYNDEKTYKFGYGTTSNFGLRKIDFFVYGNKYY